MRHAIWIMLVAALCVTEARADGNDELDACAREGERDNYSLSIEHCTAAIGSGELSAEDLAVAYVNRAISHRRLRRFEEAIRDCEKALGVDASSLDAHIACANAYGGKGDFAAGIGHFDQVLKRHPNDGETHNNRGNLLNQAGDYLQALQEFETALRLQRHFQLAQRNRGIALFNLGRFKEAAVALALALQQDPEDYPSLLWLALARGRGGLVPMSPDAVLSAAKNADHDDWPWPLIAYYAGQPFDFAVTARGGADETPETEALRKTDRECEAHFYYGEMAIIRQQKDEAKQHLQLAAEICPKTFIEHAGTLAELKRL
ncbi:tetratricopeptide repeat protein [Dongia sp.]|uniref:tetratricopeptide repeat protein n=1 Tax=Dongia sp. TaxID=1977262 RepID=UPI003751CEA6